MNIWPAPEPAFTRKPPFRLGPIFAVGKSLSNYCSDFLACYFLHFFCEKKSSKNNWNKHSEQKLEQKSEQHQRICRMVCKLIPCVSAHGLWISYKLQWNKQHLETCLCCGSLFCIAPAQLDHIGLVTIYLPFHEKIWEIQKKSCFHQNFWDSKLRYGIRNQFSHRHKLPETTDRNHSNPL